MPQEALAIARLGCHDALTETDPARAKIGLLNAIVYGKSALDILGGLKQSARIEFTEWCAPRESAMLADPLMAWFRELRHEVLKDGQPTIWSGGLTATNFVEGMKAIFGDPPPGADRWFIAEGIGMGWSIRNGDGTRSAQYVHATPKIEAELNIKQMLIGTPPQHLGETLTDTSIGSVIPLCLNYVEQLITEASDRFIPTS
jgi:hypothetical protein